MSKKRTLEDTGIADDDTQTQCTKKVKTNDEANVQETNKNKKVLLATTVPLSSLKVSPQQIDKNANKKTNSNNKNFDSSAFTFENKQFNHENNESNSQEKTNTNSNSNSNDKNDKNEKIMSDAFANYSNDGMLGFQKLLNKNTKDGDNKPKTEKQNSPTSKSKEEKKEIGFGWNSSWDNTNKKDGSLNLEFNYGTWGSVDLSSSTKIGWESQATEFNDNYETPEPVAKLNGAVDTGDSTDDTHFSAQSKIYNLDNGRYNEKGIGTVNVNTYSKNGSKKGARILCRRDLVKTTLVNAPILKQMKFELVSSKYIRFVCVEQDGDDDDDDNDNKDEKDTSIENDANKEKEKGKNKNKKGEDDDDDIETRMVTYLIKPLDSTNVKSLIDVIHKLQSEL